MRYPSFEERNVKRIAALEAHDAIEYASLCGEMGIAEHSVEDWELYEGGNDLIKIGSDARSSGARSLQRQFDSQQSYTNSY